MNRYPFLAACAALLLWVVPLCAAAPTVQLVTVSWKPVPGAGGYLLEVANIAGDTVLSEKVSPGAREKTVNLAPGRYSVRMTTLNRFLRPESTTPWIPVTVRAAQPPATVAAVVAPPPPASIDTIEPDTIDTEQPPEIVHVTGHAFSPLARVVLVATDSSNVTVPLTVGEVLPDSMSLKLPRGLLPGTYRLELTNEPGQPPVSASAQRVSVVQRIPAPIFRTATPREILTGAAHSLTVAADSLRADIQALVRSPSGTGISAAVSRASSTEVVIELPPLEETGSYSIVLTNPPDQSVEVPGAFVVRRPPAVIARVEPQVIRNNQASVNLTVSGSNFEPGARVFLRGGESGGTPIPLDVDAATPVAIKARVPAGLDPGTYDLTVINAPDSEPVYSPEPRVTILTPAAPTRKLLVSLGWMPEMPLGDWGAVYQATAVGAALRADYFLSPHGVPGSGSALDFAVGLDSRFVSFGQYSASGLIPSSLVNVAASIDPSVTWTLPFMAVTARVGGGLAYSSLLVSSSSAGGEQSSSSIDLAAMSELDVLFPLSDLLKLGVSATYRHLFLTRGMDLFGASTFVSFNF